MVFSLAPNTNSIERPNSNKIAVKIAEMMIQGNTMGMTKSLKHLHDYHGKDERVRDLANKLLKTEEANIQQMKKFL